MERDRHRCSGGESGDNSEKPHRSGETCTYTRGTDYPRIHSIGGRPVSPSVTIHLATFSPVPVAHHPTAPMPRMRTSFPQSTTVVHTPRQVIHSNAAAGDALSSNGQRRSRYHNEGARAEDRGSSEMHSSPLRCNHSKKLLTRYNSHGWRSLRGRRAGGSGGC